MNNFKDIREIYSATQEEIASAVGVNRASISNWESGATQASSSSLEKLSIFYEIGPEYFYEKELDDAAIENLRGSAAHARELEQKLKGEHTKSGDFHQLFSTTTFNDALSRYMLSMKILLATADNAELDRLNMASQINKKMGTRLDAIIRMREDENASDDPSLFELLEQLSDK